MIWRQYEAIGGLSLSLLLTLRLTLASTSRDGAEPCGGDDRPCIHVTTRMDGRQGDKEDEKVGGQLWGAGERLQGPEDEK